MSIYLGTHGKVELRREFDGNDIFSTVNVSDVNATRKRLSFDFKLGQLLTGDQVEITSTNGAALSFFLGYTKTSVKRFINVDSLGGIRFYTTFANAVNGGTTNAAILATPGSAIPIKVVVQNSDFRVIAQVNGFELNTQREVIDTTSLSDSFRNQISSLMSGSGNMSCFWEYTGETVQDLPMYLLQLVLRTKVGSQFRAKFYLKSGNHNPSGISANANDEIFYEFDGVLTACASQFSPSSTVQFTADFVTTGEIALKVSLESTDKILQEDSDDILLDQDGTAKLLLESSDT
jgi:hypothetical protein